MSYSDEPDSPSPLQSYLELLRLPNVFTAVADVAMGFFFVLAYCPWAMDFNFGPSLLPPGEWTLALLIAASAALYLAGMVLNDVFDIELDREEQPYRPLPSGRISPTSARRLGWNLLTFGVLASCGVSILLSRTPAAHADGFLIPWRTGLVGAALAVLIVLYNAGLKRTPLGPIAMGGCRMLNVLLGMGVLRGPWRIEHFVVAAGVGVYIAGVTWFARDDARRSQRWQLVAATIVMLCGVGLIGALPWLSKEIADVWVQNRQPQPVQWYAIMGLLAGFVIARTAPAILEPSSGAVRAAVGRSISALIFLDAAACFAGTAAIRGSFSIYAVIAIAALSVPTVLVGRWVSSN